MFVLSKIDKPAIALFTLVHDRLLDSFIQPEILSEAT
jgi:hypothetical protein